MAAKQGKSGGEKSVEESQPLTMAMLQEALKGVEQRIITKLEMKLDLKLKIQAHDFQEQMEKLSEKFKAVSEEVLITNEEMKEIGNQTRLDIVEAITCMAGSAAVMEERMEDMEKDNAEIKREAADNEVRLEKNEQEMLLMQHKETEFAIRIRGLQEDKNENLIKNFGKALAEVLKENQEIVESRIDKIYRVNSWMARERGWPRDVVIYFTTRRIRNEILQRTYETKLKMENQEVMVLKEIPPRMLKLRKEYKFLTDELKKRKVPFRWEIPTGLTVNYQGKRYRLVGILRAKEFYYNILKAKTLPALEESREESAEEREAAKALKEFCQQMKANNEKMEQAAGTEAVEAGLEASLEFMDSPKPMRTRATTQREKLQAQKAERMMEETQTSQTEVVAEDQQIKYSEAVGGARRKVATEGLQRLLQKYEKLSKDG